MTRLSVNVNKLATLRNSRGKNRPDVTDFSRKILEFGVAGITVHPRPDGRHIKAADVREIYGLITNWNKDKPALDHAEFNVEGFPSADYLRMISEYVPHQATLVPDPPDALTSNAGWDLERHEEFLIATVKEIKKLRTRVSLFVDPFTLNAAQERALVRINPDRVELYTERFADAFPTSERSQITARYKIAAAIARKHGIGVNAGHDLSQENLAFLVQEIPWIEEVSIGHALFCEALEQGLSVTVHNYLHILNLNMPINVVHDSHIHSPRA